MKKRVLFIVAESGYFLSHRLSLALKTKERGYDVALASDSLNFSGHQALLSAYNIPVFYVPFDRAGINPFKDLKTLKALYTVVEEYSPDIIHNVALKPILYGSLVGKLRKIPKIINALSGFGILFSSDSLKARLLKPFVSFALKRALQKTDVIVQNRDDFSVVQKWIKDKGHVHLILGAGVNCSDFSPAQEPCLNGKITFVGRLLKTKGILELLECARLLKSTHPQAVVQIVGLPDQENPDHIPESLLQKWQKEGLIKWLGQQKEIAEIYRNSHIAILPSYREGLPKSLIEACACGIPIVTTDVPGCREVVENGVNGFLVSPKDPKALYKAIVHLLEDSELSLKMRGASRQKAMDLFEDEKIQSQTVKLYSF